MRQRAPRVLVVTRSATTAEALREELIRASLAVSTAGHGRGALRCAAQQPPALVVSDLSLADMEGASMLRALRALPGLADVPAIGLCSGEPPDRASHGFQHRVARSVDPRRLVELARALLRASAGRERCAERPHVLIVHADEARRRLGSVCLRHAGYDVTAATGAAEALELIRKEPPDALVSEVGAPGEDGYELVAAVRRDARTSRLPIILTCATADTVDLDLVTAAGASSLVVDTPDLGDLVDAVASRLRSQSRRAAPRRTSSGHPGELAFLAGLGSAISLGGDREELLGEALTHCVEIVGVGCGALYLDPGVRDPALQVQTGFPAGVEDFFGDPGLLLETTRGADGAPARLPGGATDALRARVVLLRAGVPSLLVAPVVHDRSPLGALVLGDPDPGAGAGKEALLGELARELGRWLAPSPGVRKLSSAQLHKMQRLSRAAAFRDAETASHTERVSRYSRLLATLSGLGSRRSELIAEASKMHDIGKLGIPDSILRKPGPLGASERIHMQRHAEFGHRILAGESDPLLTLAATIALTHHERWDGSGYPRGLTGAQIPLEGRIVAIADVFDALTSDRVYRPAMSVDRALGLMQAGRGTHFDPHLLDLFLVSLAQVLEIRRRHPDQAPEAALAPALA